MKLIYLTPLLLAFAIGEAFAGTPINLSKDIRADARVSIDNVKGQVNVTAWDRNQIQVSGSLGSGARPLSLDDSNGREVDIKIQPGENGKGGFFSWGNDSRMEETVLNVRVPKGVSLDINVVSAPVAIDGLDGGSININTISGKVRANARTPSLKVDSVSGSVEMAGRADEAKLQTVSGDIVAPAVGGELNAETVSGRINITGGPFHKANLSTVSGEVVLNGSPAEDGRIEVDSMSGDVQLQFSNEVSAKITASSFSGDIRSDYGNPSRNEDGPGKELNTTVGGGRGNVHVETFSGDLRIRGK
jgi:hypothetical protein